MRGPFNQTSTVLTPLVSSTLRVPPTGFFLPFFFVLRSVPSTMVPLLLHKSCTEQRHVLACSSPASISKATCGLETWESFRAMSTPVGCPLCSAQTAG